MARPLAIRSGIASLFIEGALWSTIRLLSFTYELAQGADLGPQHQTPGWLRLQFVGISVGVAGVLFLAGAGLRNGARWPGRVAQALAAVVNGVLLVRGIAAVLRFSGAQAVVAAAFAVMLAVAALSGLAFDARSFGRERRSGATPGP